MHRVSKAHLVLAGQLQGSHGHRSCRLPDWTYHDWTKLHQKKIFFGSLLPELCFQSQKRWTVLFCCFHSWTLETADFRKCVLAQKQSVFYAVCFLYLLKVSTCSVSSILLVIKYTNQKCNLPFFKLFLIFPPKFSPAAQHFTAMETIFIPPSNQQVDEAPVAHQDKREQLRCISGGGWCPLEVPLTL